MNLPVANQFDPDNAAALCAASQAAYAAEPCSCAAQIDNPQTDTRVIALRSSDDLIVAFRGTQDLRNWLTDLDCRLVPFDSFHIHRGFHAALESVWRDLQFQISNLQSARLWFTGHSLGGALAMLAAFYAHRHALDCAGVYTFGQPRVGDARFRDAYDLFLKPRAFRLVHAADIVPRVPWLLAAFRHAGHEVFFPDPNLNLNLNPNPLIAPSPWQKLSTDAHNTWRELWRGKLALLADHHVDTYAALLGSAPPPAVVPAAYPLVNLKS